MSIEGDASLQDIQYHAARLLILISYCGSPKKEPKIKGRTLLAKLDFFLRYPIFLDRAVEITKGQRLDDLREYEINNVESEMIRYKYGPWDNIYYPVLAYLIATDLITVEIDRGVEFFGLTQSGRETINILKKRDSFTTLINRSMVLKRIFSNWSGTKVKDFIYRHFPEVVSLSLGQKIEL